MFFMFGAPKWANLGPKMGDRGAPNGPKIPYSTPIWYTIYGIPHIRYALYERRERRRNKTLCVPVLNSAGLEIPKSLSAWKFPASTIGLTVRFAGS